MEELYTHFLLTYNDPEKNKMFNDKYKTKMLQLKNACFEVKIHSCQGKV